VPVWFIAEETGPVRANAGTLTEIAETSTGWNSVTNAADAILGEEEEADTDLRTRRLQELADSGSTTVDAIRAAILAVEDVTNAIVLENDSAVTVDGIPPHAIEPVVLGGTDVDIAAAIFGSKAAGIQSFGADATELVEDSLGNSHTVEFSRPTVREVYIELTLVTDPDLYVGDTAVKEALVDFHDATREMGQDVIVYRLACVIMDLVGVLDITTFALGFSASPSGTVNLSIADRELAELDTSRIVLV
jgi:uncharacterized phage protein gp47/JayE